MTASPHHGIFLHEGSSDRPLKAIVEKLFLRAEAVVNLTDIDFELLRTQVGRSTEDKLAYVVRDLDRQAPEVLVLHRDSDDLDPRPRYSEIADAVAALPQSLRPRTVVPVVPIRMTEAWLLLDESEIRRVAGRPGGKARLNLPGPSAAEKVKDPKAALKEALGLAAEVSGRRKKDFDARFGSHRRMLLERLDLDGAVNGLHSWAQMCADISTAAGQLRR